MGIGFMMLGFNLLIPSIILVAGRLTQNAISMLLTLNTSVEVVSAVGCIVCLHRRSLSLSLSPTLRKPSATPLIETETERVKNHRILRTGSPGYICCHRIIAAK